MNKYSIEAMEEILENLKIKLNPEQIKQIVEEFSDHLSAEREMESYQFKGREEKCSNCERLSEDLKDITRQRDVYHNSVCERHGTRDVWIDRDTVMYLPRG